MPRAGRDATGGTVYHVLNRGNGRMKVLGRSGDFRAFEDVLAEAHEKAPMRTISYCLMPNHWHLVLWPRNDADLSAFMYWLTMTHSHRWHAAHGTTGTGHLYQGRFKSFPVASADANPHYYRVCRYVERNALRAGLVERAEDWPWCSLSRRLEGKADTVGFLTEGPEPWPPGWVEHVNEPLTDAELEAMRRCVNRGKPYGPDEWVERVAKELGLESTLRSRGRPRKE